MYIQHRRSLRSSAFLGMYLTVAIFLDITKCRSYFLREGLASVGALTAVSATIKSTLLFLEEVPKTSAMIDRFLRKSLGRESVSGFWSRSLFLWLNSTLLVGFRTGLTSKDLDELNPDFASSYLSSRFQYIWSGGKLKYQTGSDAILTETSGQILPSLPFQCMFQNGEASSRRANPASRLLHCLCIYAAIPNEESCLVRKGSVIFCRYYRWTHWSHSACILRHVCKCLRRNNCIGKRLTVSKVSRATYMHMYYRLVIRLRGILSFQVFDKSLKITQAAASDSAAMTLMNTDIGGISRSMLQLYEVVASVFELGIGIYLLTLFISYASFTAVLPLICKFALALK